METRKNIVIAGTGFGGITAALKLSKETDFLGEQYRIIAINRTSYQLYTPAMYEISAITREYMSDSSLQFSAAIPIKDIIGKRKIEFICDEAIGLSKKEKKIILREAGVLPYDILVLALGSETNYFNIPGLKENSFPLKTFADGLALRRAVENLVKEKDRMKIVVGGAGASGVELISEFVNFVCRIKKERLNGQESCEVEYLLIDAASEILSGFDEKIIPRVKKRLADIGIRIKTSREIVSVGKEEIICRNAPKENFDILIWTGGVRGPAAIQSWGLPLSSQGAILIDEDLRVQGEISVFAIGDASSLSNPQTGKPLPWNVQVAEAEGALAAKNILSLIRKQPLRDFTPRKKYPSILALGKKYAIADFALFSFAGLPAWIVKQLIELRYLLFILPASKAFVAWKKNLKVYLSND